MARKNKKIRLTESQLTRLILKEFRPAVTGPGGQVTTSTGKKFRVKGASKVERDRQAKEDIGMGGGDREVAFFNSTQLLNLDFKSSPGLLEVAAQNAKNFISQNWTQLQNGLLEGIVFLGDPNEKGTILTDPIDTIWNWAAAYFINRGQSISDVASQFSISRSTERLNRLNDFKGVEVLGSFGGQLLISLSSLQELCDFGVTLLSEPLESENLDDFFRIAALLAGNRRDIEAALNRSTALGNTWSNFKQKYLKSAIEIYNSTTGQRVQTGEADFDNPGPVIATDGNIAVNAIEYFKYALFEDGGTNMWVQFEGKAEMATKTEPRTDQTWRQWAMDFFTDDLDEAGRISVPDPANSTFVFNRIAPGRQTIVERLDYLEDYYGRQRQEAQDDLDALSNAIQQKSGSTQAEDQLEAITKLQEIMEKTTKLARAIRIKIQAVNALKLTGQGTDTAIQVVLQFNESISRKRNKKLILEQDASGNYAGNLSQYVDQLAQSQGGPFTANEMDNYTLTDEDEAALWLGRDQNAQPFKMDNLKGGDVWSGSGYAQLANDVVALIFTEEGKQRTGAYINDETSEVALPHEDSIAFYILDMKSETGDNPRWINILFQPDFAVAFEEALEAKFGQYERVIKLPPRGEEGPEEPQEEDEKGNNCPKEKISVELEALPDDNARTLKLQYALNMYINHHQIPGGTISEDGKWGRNTDKAFERVLLHGLAKDKLNHPVYGSLDLSDSAITTMSDKWKSNAKRLNRSGYTKPNGDGDITGAVALVYDLYNCNDEYGKKTIKRKSTPKKSSGKPKTPGRKESAVETETGEGKCADGSTMKKATWRDIKVQFNQKSKKFQLDKSAVDQLKVDLAKQAAAFIVNPSHNLNPVKQEQVGTFTIGIGGRIKNRKSHDWNVPDSYEKIIDKAMKNLIQKSKKASKGLDVVRNSNIIISVPCGNYTTLSESIRRKREKDFENLLRELIKRV